MIEPLQRGSYGAIRRKVDELVNQINAVFRIRIVRGDSLTEDSVTVSNGGIVIKLKGMPTVAATVGVSSTTFPLQPVQIGAAAIRIRYGTCHAIVPKIGAAVITADLTDELNPELTITETGKLYVKVDLAADTYAAENPVIAFATAVPDDVPRVSAHHELAAVTFVDDAITQITPVHQGSIDVASCAGVINHWDLG